MSTTEPWAFSAIELIERYRARELSPVEVTESVLTRIDALNPELNAFITPTPELALERARAAERAYRDGTAGRLAGVPVAIKDLTPTKGIRTTFGSLLYDEYVPDEDTPDVERLYQAGMVMLGKTNTPEFGWKGDSGNRLIGPTRNPWNTTRTAGGSSGGSGAAVAAGLATLAQGSDGAGSIRIPASFCGIFGLKPTTGLVPRVPSSMSVHSHVGPMARTVRDAALLLTVTAGYDVRDRNSWSHGIDYLADLESNIETRGLRVAWSPDLGYAQVDPEIAEIAQAAAARFEELGCLVVEDHPRAPDPWPVIEVVFAVSQYSRHIDDLDEERDRLDPGRVELLEYARTLSAANIMRAHNEWNAYYHVWRQFMHDYDLVLTPTMACPPFAAGDHKPETVAGEPTTYLGWTGFAYPFNLTGQPAATVPCGFTADGLPVGLQIVGRMREDHVVLRAAAAFERAQPWEAIAPLSRPR
jgi:aspartyl-tRNA(Asn)/glutamyl-tRNA(Gln) amidotransferase subunit A